MNDPFLRTPLVNEMIERVCESDKNMVVHHYPLNQGSGRGEKNPLQHTMWPWYQILVSMEGILTYVSISHTGATSARERHCKTIDAFLGNDDLQVAVPTTVLVSYRGVPLAWYQHPSFAYVDDILAYTDVGEETTGSFMSRVRCSLLPWSQMRVYDEGKREIDFAVPGSTQTRIYEAVQRDAESMSRRALKISR
jgi:hypothetical protein